MRGVVIKVGSSYYDITPCFRYTSAKLLAALGPEHIEVEAGAGVGFNGVRILVEAGRKVDAEEGGTEAKGEDDDNDDEDSDFVPSSRGP